MSKWSSADESDIAEAMIVDEYGPADVSWAAYLRRDW